LKNKKTAVGSARKKCRKLQCIETFFQINNLVTAKQLLSSMMQYAVNGKDWLKKDPSVILQFHKSLCIFIREGYMISKKTKKWKIDEPSDIGSPMMKGSLSDKNMKTQYWFSKEPLRNTAFRSLIILYPVLSIFHSKCTGMGRKTIW
jgi:hypothetical protein